MEDKIEALYDSHTGRLPAQGRFRLVGFSSNDVVESYNGDPVTRSLLELRRLTTKIWEGVRALGYVASIRDGWEDRW